MELRDELLTLVNDEVSLDASQLIVGDTDLLLTGLVDSLGVVEIVAWIEDRLGIEVDPIDVVLSNFRTVDAIVAYCDRRVGDDVPVAADPPGP